MIPGNVAALLSAYATALKLLVRDDANRTRKTAIIEIANGLIELSDGGGHKPLNTKGRRPN